MELDDLLDIDRHAFMRYSKTRLSGLVSSSVERDTKSRSRSISRPNKKAIAESLKGVEESEDNMSQVSSLQFKKKHLEKFGSNKLRVGFNPA